ncbi:MAG TPA: hypothetical protein PLB18_10725 [Acidobacteriota bacterium]|nr:hypothetical protein [Acidobacteriota bacterium]HND19841.1 hypothetical protein [Acidobacteriota bacterium]HNG94634.1 hypothetical protein [Acidobacteriota bacterium]HNJ39630.1 hypothetical protein [Acidobacteriota bacterium]
MVFAVEMNITSKTEVGSKKFTGLGFAQKAGVHGKYQRAETSWATMKQPSSEFGYFLVFAD